MSTTLVSESLQNLLARVSRCCPAWRPAVVPRLVQLRSVGHTNASCLSGALHYGPASLHTSERKRWGSLPNPRPPTVVFNPF
jgi:hypothetical protein